MKKYLVAYKLKIKDTKEKMKSDIKSIVIKSNTKELKELRCSIIHYLKRFDVCPENSNLMISENNEIVDIDILAISELDRKEVAEIVINKEGSLDE